MRFRALPSLLLAFFIGCSGAVRNESPPGVDAAVDAPGALPDSGVAPLDAPARVELGSMTLARSLLGASAAPDGRIRVFNGVTIAGVSSSMETYDPKTNIWSRGVSASTSRYGHATATDSSGNVYVLGGTTDGSNPIASVEMYSPATDSWTAIADLPTARLGLGAAFGSDKKLYTMGGRTRDGVPSNLVEVYSPDTKNWSKAASMPTSRFSLSIVKAVDGRLFAIGGRDAEPIPTPMSVVEVFDTTKGAWSVGPTLKLARYWFGATLGNDARVYVAGGIGDSGFLDDVEVLDQAGGGWTALQSMPEARAWIASALGSDGRIFVLGGAKGPSASTPPPLPTMLAFDPTANTWSSMTR